MSRLAIGLTLILIAACRANDTAATDTLPVTVALSPDSVRHNSHAFSPDGQKIAYWERAADSTADWLLHVANADLSAPVLLGVRVGGVRTPIIWHPDGSRLATMSSQYGIADIVLVTVSSGEVVRATRDPGLEIPLAWTDNGSTLAYLRTSADGGLRTDLLSISDLSSQPMFPADTRAIIGLPSPDGAHIAMNVIDGSSSTVWVADRDGGNMRQLTSEGLETLAEKPWSPNGKELLFESMRTGTADLWIAQIDSAAPRQLTRNVRNELSSVWSPDGAWIAFISDRGKQTDVWVIAAAGGEERRVTNSIAEERAPLVWRAGTNELTFSIQDERSILVALDLNSGAERQLSPDSLRVADFWLSPDGLQSSVIIDHGGGARDLGVVPIAGGPLRTLVSGQDFITGALHSPDGRQLAFLSDRAGTTDLWTIDVAGGAARQLVDWPGREGSFAWSEDGTEIFFTSDRESRLSDVWKVPSAGGEPVRLTKVGGVLSIIGRAGYPGVYASGLNSSNGTLNLWRLREDGTFDTVWDRSNVGNNFPFTRDSVIAMVEQPDGTARGMILSASGGGGRIILKANETAGWPTADGSALVYTFREQGASELAMLSLTDGSVRRLTTTPEDEIGAELTPDKQTAVFVRQRTVERIHSANVSALIQP